MTVFFIVRHPRNQRRVTADPGLAEVGPQFPFKRSGLGHPSFNSNVRIVSRIISSDHFGSKSRGGSARRRSVSHKEKLARTQASRTTSGMPVIRDWGSAPAHTGLLDQPLGRFYGAHRAAAGHGGARRRSVEPPVRSVRHGFDSGR